MSYYIFLFFYSHLIVIYFRIFNLNLSILYFYKLPYLLYIPVMALLCCSLCVFCDVLIVELGLWVCEESWLAIEGSLTHHPSSQGWVPGVLVFVVYCVVSCDIVM